MQSNRIINVQGVLYPYCYSKVDIFHDSQLYFIITFTLVNVWERWYTFAILFTNYLVEDFSRTTKQTKIRATPAIIAVMYVDLINWTLPFSDIMYFVAE